MSIHIRLLQIVGQPITSALSLLGFKPRSLGLFSATHSNRVVSPDGTSGTGIDRARLDAELLGSGLAQFPVSRSADRPRLQFRYSY
jgi:hypothetical protein